MLYLQTLVVHIVGMLELTALLKKYVKNKILNTFFYEIVFSDYCFPLSTTIFLFWIVVGKVFSEYICDNSVNDFPCVSGKIIVATTQTITQTALCIQNTPDIPIKLAHAGKILTLINIIINLNEFVQK